MTDLEPHAIAYVSLGSNIAPLHHLQRAVDSLRRYVDVLALSAVYQSPPYGFTDQPDFLDVAVKLRTGMGPYEFKTRVLDVIEHESGRVRAHQQTKYGPLELDLDILLWGDRAFAYGDKPWQVPHKGITQFAAVAVPLAEIAGALRHPLTGQTIAQIAAGFSAEARAAVVKTPWSVT